MSERAMLLYACTLHTEGKSLVNSRHIVKIVFVYLSDLTFCSDLLKTGVFSVADNFLLALVFFVRGGTNILALHVWVEHCDICFLLKLKSYKNQYAYFVVHGTQNTPIKKAHILVWLLWCQKGVIECFFYPGRQLVTSDILLYHTMCLSCYKRKTVALKRSWGNSIIIILFSQVLRQRQHCLIFMQPKSSQSVSSQHKLKIHLMFSSVQWREWRIISFYKFIAWNLDINSFLLCIIQCAWLRVTFSASIQFIIFTLDRKRITLSVEVEAVIGQKQKKNV